MGKASVRLVATLAVLAICSVPAIAHGDDSELHSSTEQRPAAGRLAAVGPTGATGSGGGTRFTFFGSGFGHGLGMSQWGAYGLAREGWKPPKILKLYYSGASIGEQAGPGRLRVGLTQGRSAVRLGAEAGNVRIRLGDPSEGKVVATVPSGQTWRVRVAGNRYRILDGSGTTVARVGGPSTPIYAVYAGAGARVAIPEAGHTYNRGFVEFGLYSCTNACSMRLILVIGAHEYLYGLGEVPSSWPMAAMQAQAIAARTYALTKAKVTQHRSGCDCAVYASTYDQVYAGWDKEGGTDGDRWKRAVDATRGKVVLQGGETIQAFYMSSSGGHTEDNENVWGGSPIRYLRGVCDPGDYTSANPSATWNVTETAGTVTQRLSLGIGTVTGFANAQRGVSGRILSITVKGENGQRSISGSTLRSKLGLRDDRVWVNANRQVTGEIRAKYDALGCEPGLPTSRQVAVAGGLRQRFQSATIFWAKGPGAHEVHGPVLAAYTKAGGPAGELGFPTSDTVTLDNGRLRSTFQSGTITCGDAGCVVNRS